MIRAEEIKVRKAAYHRNGCGGIPAWVVLFSFKCEDGIDHEMVGLVWSETGGCFILDLDETKNGNIDFAGGNSWRGDWFEGHLKRWLVENEEAEF